MKKIWITGAEGHIGTALLELLEGVEYQLLPTDIHEVDITKIDEVTQFVYVNRPDVIINCAGMTDVAECEKNIDEAYRVNAIGVRNVALAANDIDAKVIQISTDDVFDKESRIPYNEFDTVHPRTIYGKSKEAGEKILTQLLNRFVIIRSSWIYGIGRDFVDEVLRNAAKGGTMEVPNNQYAAPTSAFELARVICHFIDSEEYGLYHVVCPGSCSRYEFARTILEYTGKTGDLDLYPVVARDDVRPTYSVLDNMMLRLTGILGLSTQIFIALLAGALLGVVIHYWIPSSYIKDTVIVEGVLYVIGQGFIRLMQMLVVPLVFCSLVCGSMSIGDSKTLGKVGVKTIGFYLVTTALAVCIALGTALLIHPGLGLNMSAVQKADLSSTAADSSVSLVDTLLNIIPKNPIGSMANGDMLPIIVFALFVGVMLAKLGNRASVVSNFISQFNDVMMEMTMTVMKVAPVGVFCLIARTFATVGFSAFAPMLKYMGNVTLALALQCFVIYQVLLFVFTRLNPIKFVKKFLPVMGFAFSTATSNATIPMSIDTLNKKMGVSKQISSFTIPLGATINMDGTSIMQGVAVIFIAEAYGIHLTPANLATVVVTATLASIGTAGIPSVGLVTLAMVLNSVGLPTEGIALIMGIDRILDMLRTAVNITGDAVCTTIVSHQEKALNREVFNRN